MRKHRKLLFVCAGGAVIISILCILVMVLVKSGKLMLPVSKKEKFELQKGAQYAPSLMVKDTKIYNEVGEQVILKGLMVPDLRRLYIEGKLNEDYFNEVFDCCGNAIRIPVHPDRWMEDEYYLWRYLDPVVTWAIEHDKYVIIDLHFIGNVITGAGNEMIDVGSNPYEFSIEFWEKVASYFRDVPNVIFEIYNEPASINAIQWSNCANELVDIVRKTGANQLIIVSSVDYSYELSYWMEHPLDKKNIAYSAHIFPNRKGWIKKYELITDQLPVVITEWGYIAEKELTKDSYLVGTRLDYGEPMIQFMEEKEVSWIACWYDDEWNPPIFMDDRNTKTDWGKFILDKLR